MSYTVFGIFPTKKDSGEVITKLEDAGFYDYTLSHTELETAKKLESDKKNTFWHWLFDNNPIDEDRYQYASTDADTISVFVDNEEDADAVKDLLDKNGAIDIEEKTKHYIAEKYKGHDSDYPISESKKARIIAKAKNNLYFTEDRKPSFSPPEGMTDEMDSLGNKD